MSLLIRHTWNTLAAPAQRYFLELLKKEIKAVEEMDVSEYALRDSLTLQDSRLWLMLRFINGDRDILLEKLKAKDHNFILQNEVTKHYERFTL